MTDSGAIALLENTSDLGAPSVGYKKLYTKEDNGFFYIGSDGIIHQVSDDIARDNYIINGDMAISQRGTSFASVADATYTLDRMVYAKTGSVAVHTITQDTDVPTFAQSGNNSKYSFKLDCTTIDASIAAGDAVLFGQKIEGYDYVKLKDKTVTLSFWVKATKSGIYCVAFRNNGLNRSYVTEYTISSPNTWEKKVITVTLNQSGGTENYTNAVGLNVNWTILCGSTYQTTKDAWQNGNYVATANQVNGADSTDNNFWLAQVKLEIGSFATPFKTRGIGFAEELNLCERYYYRLGTGNAIAIATGTYYNSTSFYATVHFPVTMRGAPALDVPNSPNYFAIDGNGTADTFDTLKQYCTTSNTIFVYIDSNVSGTAGTSGILRTNNASSYIGFSAEL